MSVNFSKSPVWIVAVVVGLVVATALVAGYVDRPGTESQVAAATEGKCADCPKAGTEDCCKVAGKCTDGSCDAAAAAASTCAAGAGTCAQKAETAATTCPMKAAAARGCTGGQCPASK